MEKKCAPTGAKSTPSHTLCALAWAVGAEEDECNAEQGSDCLLLVTMPPAALCCSFAVSYLKSGTLATIITPWIHIKEFKLKARTTLSVDRRYQQPNVKFCVIMCLLTSLTLRLPLFNDEGLLTRFRFGNTAKMMWQVVKSGKI